MSNRDFKAVQVANGRFFIISTVSREILDDAQGYGYKTEQSAYRCYCWKAHHLNENNKKEEN